MCNHKAKFCFTSWSASVLHLGFLPFACVVWMLDAGIQSDCIVCFMVIDGRIRGISAVAVGT